MTPVSNSMSNNSRAWLKSSQTNTIHKNA